MSTVEIETHRLKPGDHLPRLNLTVITHPYIRKDARADRLFVRVASPGRPPREVSWPRMRRLAVARR